MSDWTTGTAALQFQHCAACGHVSYFRRKFCPACGHSPPDDCTASGRGTVHAVTAVHRAPTKELQQHAPYAVLLVDAEEGFRFMAHGDRTLAIGDRVRLEFRPFGGALVPHCTLEEGHA